MLRTIVIAGAVLLAPAWTAANETWRAIPEESKIEFVGGKPDGTEHAGGFKKMTAVADVAESGPEDSKLTIEIDTASLYSDDEKLTTHLKSPDFFDVRQFPKIKFVTTKIEHGEGEGSARLTADLTLLKETKSIEAPIQMELDPANENKITLTTSFELDRTKFGMTYGEGKINSAVKIKATLVLRRDN